jgi:MFS family permease
LAISGLGWRSAFGILGVVGLMWAAAWMRVGKAGQHDVAQRDSDLPVAAPVAEQRQPYRRLLLSGTFLGCVAGGFATYWLVGLTATFLPLYLRQVYGFSPAAISYVIGLPSLATVVLMLTAGVVSQRLVKRGTSRRVAQGLISGGGVLLAGAALLVMTGTGAATMATVMITIATATATLQIPLGNAALADAVPAAQRSAVLGVWYGTVSLASIAAPYVTGLILDSAPSVADGYRYAFVLAGVLLVVGGGLAALLIKPDRGAVRLRTSAVIG